MLAGLSSRCFKYTSAFNLHSYFDGNVIFPALKTKNLIIWRLPDTLPDIVLWVTCEIRISMTIIVVIKKQNNKSRPLNYYWKVFWTLIDKR